MKKKIFALLLCTTLLFTTFLTACGRTGPTESGGDSNNTQSDNYELAYYPYDYTYDPALYVTPGDPEIYFNGQDEREEIQHTFDPVPLMIYYDFFADNFTIIEYEGLHGAWQLWGHETQGEVRLMKQAQLNLIDGFEYPVLILVEYTLDYDGINIIEVGLYNAYLIRDGRVCSDLSRSEKNAIFREVKDYEMGWFLATDDGFIEAEINGENVFFIDFAGDVRTDDSMDRLLSWLRG